jgi:hypothetical protein
VTVDEMPEDVMPANEISVVKMTVDIMCQKPNTCIQNVCF